MISIQTLYRFLLSILILLAPFACIPKTKDEPGQTPGRSPAAAETPVPTLVPIQTPPQNPSEVVLGGFVSISKDSPGAEHAYEFLKDKLAVKYPKLELGALTAAAAQVVAGVKTRLACEYTEAGNRARQKNLTALVFIDLDGNDSLMEVKLDVAAQ
jgi:hypothetical protein